MESGKCHSTKREPLFMTGKMFSVAVLVFMLSVLLSVFSSCARMGSPDGGWYDEIPPKVVSCSPSDRAVGISDKKIYINFNEFIKIDNPSEKVIVSPPQLEVPEIKSQGKRIMVELKDSLKQNTTYTIDFSDAITDNNEGNPLGNFTYTFSTGDVIDTLEVAGYVVEAENLEPVKGIMVGLYPYVEDPADNLLADTTFTTTPFLRVSRTDSRGFFSIKGVAPGAYRVYALADADGNFMKSQKSEKLAFLDDIIIPTFKDDVRQDTVWRDSLHIERIDRVNYTHFLPDDITLRAFTEVVTDRYLVKSERLQANLFTLYFSYGDEQLPEIKGLNFDSSDAFLVKTNEHRDTIQYWLRDSLLIDQDTLDISLIYRETDTLGLLQQRQDTLQLLSKQPYERRQKELQKKIENWQKQQEKQKKRGLPYDTVMRPEPLEMKVSVASTLNPDRNIILSFPTPLQKADASVVHLYAMHDSLWYEAMFELAERTPGLATEYELRAEWKPGIEYSLEIDSLAFTDIYGASSNPLKKGFKVKGEDEFATILLNIEGFSGKTLVVQLIDQTDKMVKELSVDNGRAEFFYVEPKRYYVRMFVDENQNGRWDTGDYDARRQAEPVYYYPEAIECRAKWDYTESWNPTGLPVFRQKPSALIRQKADKKRTVKSRNAELARKKGIPLSQIPQSQ